MADLPVNESTGANAHANINTEASARRLFLESRDVPCPRCRYNLRGVTTDHCPECGHAISLILARAGLSRRARRLVLLLGAWILALNGVAAWTQYNFLFQFYRATIGQAERSVLSRQERVDKLESERRQLLAQSPNHPSLAEVDAKLAEERDHLAELQATRDGLPRTVLGYFFHWPGTRWMSPIAALGVLISAIGLFMIAMVNRPRRVAVAVCLGIVLPAIAFSVLLVHYARLIWQM